MSAQTPPKVRATDYSDSDDSQKSKHNMSPIGSGASDTSDSETSMSPSSHPSWTSDGESYPPTNTQNMGNSLEEDAKDDEEDSTEEDTNRSDPDNQDSNDNCDIEDDLGSYCSGNEADTDGENTRTVGTTSASNCRDEHSPRYSDENEAQESTTMNRSDRSRQGRRRWPVRTGIRRPRESVIGTVGDQDNSSDDDVYTACTCTECNGNSRERQSRHTSRSGTMDRNQYPFSLNTLEDMNSGSESSVGSILDLMTVDGETGYPEGLPPPYEEDPYNNPINFPWSSPYGYPNMPHPRTILGENIIDRQNSSGNSDNDERGIPRDAGPGIDSLRKIGGKNTCGLVIILLALLIVTVILAVSTSMSKTQ
nr:hypothetical protein PsAHV6-063 [Psittacid alphaherpesvirus 6]